MNVDSDRTVAHHHTLVWMVHTQNRTVRFSSCVSSCKWHQCHNAFSPQITNHSFGVDVHMLNTLSGFDGWMRKIFLKYFNPISHATRPTQWYYHTRAHINAYHGCVIQFNTDSVTDLVGLLLLIWLWSSHISITLTHIPYHIWDWESW